MKQLPFSMNVPIQTYNHHADFLGIMFTVPNYIKYFISDYINIVCTYYTDISDFYLLKGYLEKGHYFEKIIMNCAKDQSQLKSLNDEKSFQTTLQEMIQDHYYIYGDFNEFFIPNRAAYKSYGFGHNYLISAYDNDYFKIMGYTINRKFEETWVHSNQIYEAILDLNRINNVIFIRPNRKFECKVQLNQIKESLSDYLNGIDSSGRDFYYYESQNIFGIDVLRLEISQLVEKKGKDIDIRKYSMFLEHKKIMYQRIVLLGNQVSYPAYEKLLCDIKKIIQYTDMLFHTVIKFGITRKSEVLDRIIKMLQTIIAMELEAYPYFMELLDKLNEDELNERDWNTRVLA